MGMKRTPLPLSSGDISTVPGAEPRWRSTAAASSIGVDGAPPFGSSNGLKAARSRPLRSVRRHSSSSRLGMSSRSKTENASRLFARSQAGSS